MNRTTVAVALAGSVLAGVALVSARQSNTPPQTTFRGGIDLFQLDVTVIDKDRHPVKGLTARDFVVLEDGKPRPIATFKEVSVAPVVKSEAGWVRDVPADVTSNERPEGRVMVVVIDDASFQPTESEGTAPIMETLWRLVKLEEAKLAEN